MICPHCGGEILPRYACPEGDYCYRGDGDWRLAAKGLRQHWMRVHEKRWKQR